MSKELQKKLGEELKLVREEKNISLKQINSKSRIDMKFLRAIESGHFQIMPEVYIKAFIRDYSTFIGLDPDIIITKYQLAKQGLPYDKPESSTDEPAEKTEEAEPPIKKVFDSSTEVSSPYPYKAPTGSSSVLIAAIGGLVVIALIVVYFIFFTHSSDQIIIETPYEKVLKDQTERFKVEKEPAQQKITTAADSLRLKISTSDTSWMRILIDDTIAKEFILMPNSSKTLKASLNFKLLLGNSGGIKLFLNDKPLNFVGRKGSVRNLTINAGGLLSGKSN